MVKAISRVPGAPLPNGGMRPKQPVKLISVKIERVGPEPAPPAPAKKAAPAVKKSATPAKAVTGYARSGDLPEPQPVWPARSWRWPGRFGRRLGCRFHGAADAGKRA